MTEKQAICFTKPTWIASHLQRWQKTKKQGRKDKCWNNHQITPHFICFHGGKKRDNLTTGWCGELQDLKGQIVFLAGGAITLLKCKNHSHLMVLTKTDRGPIPLAMVSRPWSREIWSLGHQFPSSIWASHLVHEIRGLDKGCFPYFNFFFHF